MSQIAKKRTVAFGTLAVVIGLSLGALLMVSNPATADGGGGHPAAKATAQVADIALIQTTTQQDWITLLGNTMHTPNQKDLFIDVSLECGLYTDTEVRSKGGNKDTSTAEATITVRVLVDGDEAYPGEVVFANRLQMLSATLEGMIAGCLTVNDDGIVILDPDCVVPEEIELVLQTMSANSFNFIMADLSAGTHTIEVQAKIVTNAEWDQGNAEATATVGKGSVTVQLVRMIRGEDIVLED